MLHIDIWADFACPACYLAKPGTCTIPQTPIPSPGAAPVTGAVLPGMEETPSA